MYSQKTRILALLTRSPICATTMLAMHIPRGAARISDLRTEGWLIETRECRQHSHQTRQVEYVLTNSPGVMQPELAKKATPTNKHYLADRYGLGLQQVGQRNTTPPSTLF